MRLVLGFAPVVAVLAQQEHVRQSRGTLARPRLSPHLKEPIVLPPLGNACTCVSESCWCNLDTGL